MNENGPQAPSPEIRDTRAYRQALAVMLAQFMHGEEISFTAVPLGLQLVSGEELCREVERQLEDEKRHHKMFDAERVRLSLPRETPNEAMTQFHDIVLGRMHRADVIGAVIAGCFMLEGAAFSTLLTHCNAVDDELSRTFKEIVSDEARHIALNVSVVQGMIAESPDTISRLVEVHRETLPTLFALFKSFKLINNEMGIDNEWFTMRCLFHHSQRIRRLHLPTAIAKTMLADTLGVAQTSG